MVFGDSTLEYLTASVNASLGLNPIPFNLGGLGVMEYVGLV
jgi:hypothetical protein